MKIIVIYYLNRILTPICVYYLKSKFLLLFQTSWQISNKSLKVVNYILEKLSICYKIFWKNTKWKIKDKKLYIK